MEESKCAPADTLRRASLATTGDPTSDFSRGTAGGKYSGGHLHLHENQTYLFAREYTDCSEDKKQTLDKFLDYGKTQQKLERWQAHLEVASA